MVYLWPRPTQDELDRFYVEQYRLTNPHPPAGESARDYELRAALLRPLLVGRPTLLEVGAGSGEFLELVRPFTSRSDGVEPEQGTSLEQTVGHYDIVGAFHVLEHVADPVGFLRQLGFRLAKGGALAIEVPNLNDVLVRLPWFRRFYFQLPHLWYFSPATLAATFERAGFDVAVTMFQRYDLSNHLRWLIARRPGGRGAYPLPAAADRTYAALLRRAGLADTIFAVGRR